VLIRRIIVSRAAVPAKGRHGLERKDKTAVIDARELCAGEWVCFVKKRCAWEGESVFLRVWRGFWLGLNGFDWVCFWG